jgi:hypothetical protein
MLILYASVPLLSGAKPVLYGKVYYQASTGFKKPLARVKIQLLELKIGQQPGKVLYQTYTSPRGYFAFYNVPRGQYYLKALKNNEPFYQLKGNQKVKVSIVNVRDPSKSVQLPDIFVSR